MKKFTVYLINDPKNPIVIYADYNSIVDAQYKFFRFATDQEIQAGTSPIIIVDRVSYFDVKSMIVENL